MREATVETFRVPQVQGTPPVFDTLTPIPTNTPVPTNTPPPYYSPTPSIPLCFEEGGWYAMHWHEATGQYNYVGASFHEGHGLPDGPVALSSVIIESVNLKQEFVDTVEKVDKVQVGWYTTGVVDYPWYGDTSDDVTIPIGMEMPWWGSWCGYRATYVTFYLRGDIDGNYKITLTIYIPEYDHRCVMTAEYYTIPPTPEPPKDTSTPGPSPTSPPPTNTQDPEVTPGGPTNTPDQSPPED
jgi:hypothetical protein